MSKALDNLHETALLCVDYVELSNSMPRGAKAKEAVDMSYETGKVVDPDDLGE
jgi:hypothetical protein